MPELALKCRCGEVQGIAAPVKPGSGTRAVCYCNSCQAFAHYLGSEGILNSNGGTDVVQLPPAWVRITSGADQLRCMRLSSKGTYRWYTGCCRTPIGNTLSASWPFVGLIHNFMETSVDRNETVGPVRGHVYLQAATGTLPEPLQSRRMPWFMIAGAMLKVLRWKVLGLNRPSPFFDESGQPVSEPTLPSGRPAGSSDKNH